MGADGEGLGVGVTDHADSPTSLHSRDVILELAAELGILNVVPAIGF
jgi:hypothetical protein